MSLIRFIIDLLIKKSSIDEYILIWDFKVYGMLNICIE